LLAKGTDLQGQITTHVSDSVKHITQAERDLWNANSPMQNVYSTTEQDTGKIWIDGKKIYRRVFTGTTTSPAGSVNNIQVATGIDKLIAQGGWADLGGYYDIAGTNRQTGGNPSNFSCSFFINTSHILQLQIGSILALTNKPYELWLEYTKV